MKISMKFMKRSPFLKVAFLLLLSCSVPWVGGGGCGGGTGTGNPLVLQAAPLAGPHSAALRSEPWLMAFMDLVLGVRQAFAAVSSFTSFKLCNDTLVMTDVNGNPIAIDGVTLHEGLGVLTFSPTIETPMTLASPGIAAGVEIKEIHVTSAVRE